MRENEPRTPMGRRAIPSRQGKTILTALAMILGSFPASGAERTAIADKTLVAWVAPANLTQRGGSVLTIEKPGGVFDAIVFGEIAESKWMAGSDGFHRTRKEQESFPKETADRQSPVQIAVVYKGRQITLYRDGKKYADYTAGGAEQFGGDSLVLMGLRHTDAGPDNRFFMGSILPRGRTRTRSSMSVPCPY